MKVVIQTMIAFDKTAQGTAVLEASGNARRNRGSPPAPPAHDHDHDGKLKARRAVGEIPALRADKQGEAGGRAANAEGPPIHTTGGAGAVCCCRPLGWCACACFWTRTRERIPVRMYTPRLERAAKRKRGGKK